MPETIDNIVAISMLVSGLFITLIGFDIIKLKANKPEDEERMIVWRKKFGKYFKIVGIGILIIGVFLILSPNSNNKKANWTQLQKEEMKKLVINSSNFLQSINPDTADLIVNCIVDKYTAKYTLQESWEQEKMTKEQIMELTIPIWKECLELYNIQTKK